MTKVVLDTNIYLSGLIWPESLPGQVLKLARKRRIEVFCSRFILDELKKILSIKFDYPQEFSQRYIEELLKFVKIVKPQVAISVISKKDDDNRILECALKAKADVLISGDRKHILPLKKVDGTQIISAREFIRRFRWK